LDSGPGQPERTHNCEQRTGHHDEPPRQSQRVRTRLIAGLVLITIVRGWAAMIGGANSDARFRGLQ
jgi:hypothetical protein